MAPIKVSIKAFTDAKFDVEVDGTLLPPRFDDRLALR